MESKKNDEPQDLPDDNGNLNRDGLDQGWSARVPKDDDASPERGGLTTPQALMKLHQEMQNEIDRVKCEFSRRGFISWLKESVSFASELSKMRWPSVIFMTAQVIAHFIVGFVLKVDNMAIDWVGFQGFILVSLLVVNLYVNLWDTKLRYSELLMKSEQLSILVKRCSEDTILIRGWRHHSWDRAHVKTLFAPKSPCVHQTLTYRDSSCLNLPDFLLVKGDVIHLYPGDRSPGKCISVNTINNSDQRERMILLEGQTYGLSSKCRGNIESVQQETRADAMSNKDKRCILSQFDHAKSRGLVQGTDFLMLSTPYIGSLRMSLDGSHMRPVNSIEKECFIISRKYFETLVIPLVFVLSTLMTAIHYGYLDFNDSDHKIKTITIAYLLLRPSLTVMPFLPWMFPLTWLLMNAYGSAKLICCADAQRLGHVDVGTNVRPDFRMDHLLATPTTVGDNISSSKHDDDDIHSLKIKVKFGKIMAVFSDLIRGRGGHVWRSSSLLQVLGCLTSLCCIDKVGILSWPSPTPEKIFMLVENPEGAKPEFDLHQELAECPDKDDDPRRVSLGDSYGRLVQNKSRHGGHKNNSYRTEVLDVSQSLNFHRSLLLDREAFDRHSLQFDDQNWRRYANNLKPLGLTILLNNCCDKSFGDYYRFYKHISYESLTRCDQTPVVKRRCICELAKLIGFAQNSIHNFQYKKQIGVYKLTDSSVVRKAKIVSALDTNPSRLKFPLPNMVCNVQQDVSTGTVQLFSQGTADLVVDSCMDFWDGKKLVPLDDSSRKKILDFYQRTSLTSYCTAFAYAPSSHCAHNLTDRCIELSYDYSRFGSSLRKVACEFQEEILKNQIMVVKWPKINHPRQRRIERPSELTTSGWSTRLESEEDDECVNELSNNFRNLVEQHRTRRHMSVGDLGETQPKYIKSNDTSKTNDSQMEFNDALGEISDQVFIGQVALQYQPCPDFVALIEQLEHACIRFIHFSEENELRSRVFSEKMGLESGWNCHISLQPDEADDEPLDHRNDYSSDPKILAGEIIQDEDEDINNFEFKRSHNVTKLLLGDKSSNKDGESCATMSSNGRSLYSYRSLPSLVMQLTAKLFSEREHHHHHKSDHKKNAEANDQEIISMQSGHDHIIQDSSRGSIENSTENAGFDPLAFDMSNRAKLPKGIKDIRPHLENIDNIPLQVSLFTDCNTELTTDMIKIMQDYGEIVCVVGSASNAQNTPVFLQANASIAIDPLKPSTCSEALARGGDESAQVNVKQQRKKGQKKIRIRKSSKRRHHDAVKSNVPDTRQQQHPRDRLGIKHPAEQNPTKIVVSRPNNSNASSSISSSSSSCSSMASRSFSNTTSSTSTSGNETTSDVDSESYCGSESDDQRDDDIEMSQDYLNEDEKGGSNTDSLITELPLPCTLASRLASLPCAYTYDRTDPVNLYGLIMEARHFTFKMKNTFVCMICFALSISSAQFLVSLLFLPPMFSSGLTIWLTVIVVPLMSFPLMKTTMDSQVMKIAVGKNLQLKPENITFFVICYLIKFIPSIIVVVLCYGLIIDHSCKLTGFGSSSVGPCWMFTYVQHANSSSTDVDHPGDEDLLWSAHLLTAQVSAAFLLVLYFVVISSGFVHRSHLIWQRSPTSNHFWVIISLVLLLSQLLFNFLILHLSLDSYKIPYEFLSSLPIHIWLISFLWPVVAISINLIVKQAEIRAIIRQQRRARFDFNTKLGMNSPF